MLSSIGIYQWDMDMVIYISHSRSLKSSNSFLFSILSLCFSCKERDQAAKGCESVSPSPFQMGLATALDPGRDLQRLNTLIMNNLNSFKLLLEPGSFYSKEFTSPDDMVKLRKTIKAITDTAIHLDQIHRSYKAILDRGMQYGSRQAPIGDDNYYLTRGNASSSKSMTAAAAAVAHQHHTLPLDKSPKVFIRNEMLRSSLTNDNFSNYWTNSFAANSGHEQQQQKMETTRWQLIWTQPSVYTSWHAPQYCAHSQPTRERELYTLIWTKCWATTSSGSQTEEIIYDPETRSERNIFRYSAVWWFQLIDFNQFGNETIREIDPGIDLMVFRFFFSLNPISSIQILKLNRCNLCNFYFRWADARRYSIEVYIYIIYEMHYILLTLNSTQLTIR